MLLGSAGAAYAAEEIKGPPGKVVIATVGDSQITLEDLNAFIAALPANVRMAAQLKKDEILDGLVSRRLIYYHAKSQGIEKREAVKKYVARARQEIMVRLAVVDLQEKALPTEKEIRAEYDKNKEDFRRIGKVTASHIMVANEKEAKDILEKLNKGSDFAELAKKYSLAPERQKGGSLGEMTGGQHQKTGLPEVIEKTAFSLKAGEHSGVVKSQFGWHVVRTSKKEESGQMSFDQVRGSIENKLSEFKQAVAIEGLLKTAGEKYKTKKYPERLK
jgi:peptidyl-prolyl cis-trans isomerase C